MRLKIEHISKSFGDREVLSDINLTLGEGEIVSILGVSGVGKTTLFNVISGVYQPEQGKIYLEGRDITGKPGNISYMLQNDMMFPYKSVLDNVALPLQIKSKGNPFTRKKKARSEAEKYFEEFGLGGYEKKYPAQLSGGMRQRAALLRTYLFSSQVALLDEPFSALDTITKSAMHEWYLQVMEKIKLSTLFITHDIDEAILLSDRIYILSGRPGRITDMINVEKPHLKDDSFLLSAEFIGYKKAIRNRLEM